MNKYNHLLGTVAEELNIFRGNTELETEWKKRVIYSLIGRTASAALWDTPEDLQPVSITHFKRRIGAVLQSCMEMYPEAQEAFQNSNDDLSNEIYDIFLNTGNLYYTPYRIAPPVYSMASAAKIVFTRSAPLGSAQFVSGVGCYRLAGEQTSTALLVREMFQLQEDSLQELWQQLITTAIWEPITTGSDTEYLRMGPPFKYSYWTTSPDRSCTVSLARVGEPGKRLYYLFRLENEKTLGSQLPQWRVEKNQYRAVANACLASTGTLPADEYRVDGAIVHLRLNYLPPPAELNLLKLYSWPNSYLNLPHDFNRIVSTPVFFALKTILEPLGYQFVEG